VHGRGMSRSAGFAPALPALILLSFIFIFPVARFLSFSVEAGHFDWYAQALGKQLYLRVLWDTFEIAALVTLFCLLLGYPLGFLIATTTPLWATVGFVFVLLPLLHNFTGVLIGMVHVLLPYMVLLIYGAVRRLDPAIVQAAQGLGASTWQIIWRIYVPLTMNGIFAGCVIVFVLSLGFFITPALLGGGRVIMIAVLIEQQVRETLNWPFAAALSAVLLAATLLVYALAQRFGREEPAS
jgi:ABC-type spermidine/putrescine transport system permease subunit I